jgi:GT2 family glycosyltransferase
MSSSPDGARAPRVAAIVVSHDGERWIPHLIDSLERSTRVPDRILAVDTGSRDGSKELLTAVLGARAVVDAPEKSGFGDAVRMGIAALDATISGPASATDDDWLWLLHDDCAPAPDALERLLDVVAEEPDVSVVGCRIRAWPRARRLIEVGVTITGTGHRETGLELGEYDQGQHDGVRRVLAVSSAGMLVRRGAWDRLGGFDRRLPLFRDDVDFGWRVARAGGRVVISPDAIVFHAEAATRGVRAIANTSSSPHRADRKAALLTVLANCSAFVLPFQYVRLLLGSLLRAVGYLVGKLPSAAWDEVAALPSIVLRPDRIVAARLARRKHATASRSSVRALLPAWWTPYANGIESVSSRFADTLHETATSVATSARRLRPRGAGATHRDTETTDDAAVNLPAGAGPVVWALNHPISSLAAALTVVALVATRGLWGGGLLQGGGLLPAPDAAADWWQLYSESWHPVALGSTDAASPYVAALAGLGTVLIGKAWLAVDLLMLLCVPLACVGALVAARRLVRGLAAQIWMAVAYAILPVVTGAATSGRIGTVAAAVLLPWLVVAVLPIFDLGRPLAWRPVFATAIVLALITAFAPLAFVVATALAVLAVPWLVMHGAAGRVARLAVAIAVPVALLAPWSIRFLADPAMVLTEAGVVDPQTGSVSSTAWQLAFGRLAASGDAPWWITAGFLLAAVVALLRSDRRQAVTTAWLVIAVAAGTTALVAGRVVSVEGSNAQAWAWVGLPVLLAQAAAIVAGGVAADGVTGFIQAGSFGWRQPLAATTAVVAVLSPIAGLAWWTVVAPRGELDRATDDRLPAYIVDGLGSDSNHRVLVLTGVADQVDYDLVLDDGTRLGDDSVDPRYGSTALDTLISDLLSEGQPSDADRLADFGIGYVMLPSPADPDLVTALDGLPGLTRASTDPSQVVGWQLDQPAGLVRVFDPDAADGSAAAGVIGSAGGKATAEIGPGSSSRVVGVAVPPDQDFRASLDGEQLDIDEVRGTVRFALGPDSGSLEVTPPGQRAWWLLAQGLLWAAAIVLATPSAARRQGIAEVVE